jgi:hypothetical protein
MSHGHHLSEEESMRQMLLQHAMARQEEQERWRLEALARAEEAQRQAFFAPFPLHSPAAVAMPPWFGPAPGMTHGDEMTVNPEPMTVENEEELQLRRAMEESKREEEERKRRLVVAEEEERRRHLAIEHEARRQQLLRQQQQQQYQHETADEEEDEEEDEARREALEEAKQVQLALQLSLAEQQHARQRADHNLDEEDDEVDDPELADALRLSKLVHKSPEERLREEQAIYRSALINEQNREYEESRQRDLMKEEEKRRRQMERDRARELISLARSKEVGLVPEPPAGAEATTELVVRLPDGRRTLRRFPQEAALQGVKDWIDVELAKEHELEQSSTTDGEAEATEEDDESQAAVKTNAGAFLVGGYDLVADFPRRVFTDMQASASQAGLCPRALLNLARK